jgi:tryptophanyl-tRNA synthetase
MRIVTDSREPGEPKDTQDSALFTIFRAFADAGETETFRADLEGGLGWGEAKQRAFERIDRELAPMRERYEQLIAQPDQVEDRLRAGAAKARTIAAPLLEELREAVGLGQGAVKSTARAGKRKKKSGKTPRLVSFRDGDGNFRFRLLDAAGEELALSRGFADPKSAGQCSRQLLTRVDALQIQPQGDGLALQLEGETLAQTPALADPDAHAAVAERVRAALTELAAIKAD